MFLKPLLAMFAQDLIQESAKQIVKSQVTQQMSDSIRVEFLRLVSESYSREVTYNISQYIKSIETASVEISSGNKGEELYEKFQKTLGDLAAELEQQGPESPVTKYLQEKYGSFENSVVGLSATPVYSIVSGFNSNNSPDQPWLNRVLARDQEVGDILAAEASRIFDRIFSTEVS